MTPDPLRKAISQAWLADEESLTEKLIAKARFSSAEQAATEALAADLVQRIRHARDKRSAVDAFTQEYALSSEEGRGAHVSRGIAPGGFPTLRPRTG